MLDGILADPVVQLVIFVSVVVIFMDAYRWVLNRVWNMLGGDDE